MEPSTIAGRDFFARLATGATVKRATSDNVHDLSIVASAIADFVDIARFATEGFLGAHGAASDIDRSSLAALLRLPDEQPCAQRCSRMVRHCNDRLHP